MMSRTCTVAVAAAVLLCLATAADAVAVKKTYKAYWSGYAVDNPEQLDWEINPTNTGGMTHAATIEYTPSFGNDGWDVVRITGAVRSVQKHSQLTWYAAGLLEGYATHASMWDHFSNIKPHMKAASHAWFQTQYTYLKTKTYEASMAKHKETWGLRLIVKQMDGMYLGYMRAVAENKVPHNMTFIDMYRVNLESDLSAAHAAVGFSAAMPNETYSGTGFVKLTDNDLLLGHNMWASFGNLYRQHKTYQMEETITFAAHPGVVTSTEAFYATSNGIAVMQTSLSNFNATLAAASNTPSSVPTTFRARTATYFNKGGKGWHESFVALPGGSGKSSFLVVDLQKYVPGQRVLQSDLLWLVEEMHDLTMAQDITAMLQQQSFFATLHVPYFPAIAAHGDYDIEAGKPEGWYFNRMSAPIHRQFVAKNATIFGIEDMQNLMRYNAFKTDPLSLVPNCLNTTCSPAFSALLAIAGRGDVNPANASFGTPAMTQHIGHREFGAIDGVVSSYRRLTTNRKLVLSLVNGPVVTEAMPQFNFATFGGPPIVHAGIPALVPKWAWLLTTVDSITVVPLVTPDYSRERLLFIAIGISAVVALGLALYLTRPKVTQFRSAVDLEMTGETNTEETKLV
jgi:hypothetical protein